MVNPQKTGNIEYPRRRQTKQKHNTIGVSKHYKQINTNNVYKTRALLQTPGGKDVPNMFDDIILVDYVSFYI